MIVRPVIIAILCVTVALAGCQTMKPVDLAADKPVTALLEPNDTVQVWMRDGRVLELQLTAVEADALVSGQQRVPLKDIERIERRGVSVLRTTLLVLGIVALAALGLGIYASHHICVMHGC